MKKTFITLAFIAWVFLSLPAQAIDITLRVALINMNTVITFTNDYKKGMKKIEKSLRPEKNKVEKLKKTGTIINGVNKSPKYLRVVRKYNALIKKKKQELFAVITKKYVETILPEIQEEGRFDAYIYEPSQVSFTLPIIRENITERAIVKYNKRFK